MSIAKSIRKSGRGQDFAQGLGAVINALLGDDAMEQLMQATKNTSKDITSRFDPRPNQTKADMIGANFEDPFLQSGGPLRKETALKNINLQPDTKVDINAATQESMGDIAEFVMSQLGKDVPSDQLNLALEGLDLKRSSLIPGETEGFDFFATDPDKDVYDKNTGKLITKGVKDEKQKDKFKNFSAKGYWDVSDPDNPKWVTNPNYKSDATGSGGDNLPDPSKLQSNVLESIAKMKAIKNSKMDKTTGFFNIPDPSGFGNYEGTQEEVTGLKDQYKRAKSNEALEMIKVQGLQDAVDDIKSLLEIDPKTKQPRGASLDNLESELNRFIKNNPEYDDTDKEILRDYFTFFLL